MLTITAPLRTPPCTRQTDGPSNCARKHLQAKTNWENKLTFAHALPRHACLKYTKKLQVDYGFDVAFVGVYAANIFVEPSNQTTKQQKGLSRSPPGSVLGSSPRPLTEPTRIGSRVVAQASYGAHPALTACVRRASHGAVRTGSWVVAQASYGAHPGRS